MKSAEIPKIGGILYIVCGVFGLLNGLIFLIANFIFTEHMFFLLMPPGTPQMSFLVIQGIFTLILGPIVIYAGICAIRRKQFVLAILGGIAALEFGIAALGLFIILFALLGLILIIVARGKFR